MTEPIGEAGDPLAVLEVIDRLEVGPARVEPNSVSTPYRVVAGGAEDVIELVYRWQEAVFDPDSPADRNLASMVTAQLALNYGLFCRRIVFHGPFDREDRRFLRAMMANTSREIYVLKFLHPNPFLTGAARELPVVQRRDYTRAELRFEGERPSAADGAATPWRLDGDRYGILSSGGKDSLLSQGLLSELGYETHPIYLNESGRHWLTAMNAYRHFRDAVPNTARVWTNSDRLFAWMLRHLPFVRKDFQKVRSDEYPIRLWTVAVFLFGALPLLAKRGVRRLVIGDEHDTTVRLRHRGIPHYGGLYDQSRYFDQALSRYFQRKGWGVTQLSILRPLSEFLIEKILSERYPDLLRHQVSCHAAHTEGERVRPCGRCEKCRRIAGMLRALGTDPAVCGYPPERMGEILDRLVTSGVHQERPAAEHLAWLLDRRGLLAEPRVGEARARERPEVLAVRVHPERSPVEELPVKLRRPLYEIFRQHATGVLRRVGRQWLASELGDEELARPYPFDLPAGSAAAEAHDAAAEQARSHLWGELTWPQAERRLREMDVALLPVGAVEQHGHHMPLDTDSYDADYLAREVALGCSEPRPLVLPLIPYGVSYHHEDFPGTLSVSNETLARLVYEVGMEAARNGVTKLVIINGHGGNAATLQFAAQTINRDAHIFTCVDTGETSDPDVEALAETANDVHAGEIETSTTLANRPHLVRMEETVASVPRFSSHYLEFSSHRSVEWYARTAKLSTTGVLGDPTKGTREKGERMWRIMIRNLVELVEHLKSLSLDEIYERRY